MNLRSPRLNSGQPSLDPLVLVRTVRPCNFAREPLSLFICLFFPQPHCSPFWPHASRHNSRVSLHCDFIKQKCAFALIIERVCTIFVLVEKLCKLCERRCILSHTFRLPSTGQSETIPRCLTAA